MQFLFTNPNFPFSAAVTYSERTLETVLTGIPRGATKSVEGGVAVDFSPAGGSMDVGKSGQDDDCIGRLYLQEIPRDIAAVNGVHREYFASHPPNHRAYGVDLQSGKLVEDAFVAELPEEP